ncbi:MAG: hypothetical protein JWO19_5815 [Bryobacterales bacterium]|nr:hypothetical protein [Bryobacterales bacterium]
MAVTNRYWRGIAVFTSLALGLCLGLAPLAGQGAGATKSGKGGPKAAPKAGPFNRLSDGKPDMQGYWATRTFFSAFDLEEHKEASFEVPAGKGVVVDPADGKIPYQPWAAARRRDLVEHHLAEDPQAHCFLSGVPRQMYTPFGFQILQPEGAVVLFYEAFHAYRIIRLDGKPHPGASIKLFQGDSKGRWEGDTLIVDVTNLNDRTWFDMAGNFHSDAMHVVERYTPVDADTINYEATIDDSKVFTRPWKIAFDLGRNRDPNYENLEYACVEGEQDLQHYTESEGGGKK